MSDPLGVTAQGVEIIRRTSENKLRQTLARIEALARIRGGNLCLRLPQEYEQYHRRPGGKIPGFKRDAGAPHGDPCGGMWDERLTTVEANRTLMGGVRRENRKKNMWISWLQFTFCRAIWTVRA